MIKILLLLAISLPSYNGRNRLVTVHCLVVIPNSKKKRKLKMTILELRANTDISVARLSVNFAGYKSYREKEIMSHNNWINVNNLTVVCSVTWPLNGSEGGGDLPLIRTSLLLSCKCT